MINVYISSDHRGFDLKNELLSTFSLPEGFSFSDLGPAVLDETDDYNDAAKRVSEAVLHAPGSFGILVCGSGTGVAIAANRHAGIRAVVGWTPKIAELARAHEDANVICFAADFQNSSEAKDALQSFLTSVFSEEPRHVRRINRLDEMEIL
ncbi:RpiB/LacA/LacB family sugar-phosphate isomerase [Candidatus Saccharibacteria bacterium]|nr:RpiB/LacA/LacB family sugar-phosphate isomerase [Candidatus Saccharibacteria bacterium]